jgi:hypothetical protein
VVKKIAVIYSPSQNGCYIEDNPTSSGIPFSPVPEDVDNLTSYYSNSPKGGGHYRSTFRIFMANVYSKTSTHIRALNTIFDITDPRVISLVERAEIGIENHAINDNNVFVYDNNANELYRRGNIGSITSYTGQGVPSRVLIYTDESKPKIVIVYP